MNESEVNNQTRISEKALFSRLNTVKRVMVDSLMKNYTPFPINREICSRWALDLEHGGETVIYTSFMYQLSGLFRGYEKHISAFAKMGGSVKLASLGRFFIKPDKDDLERAGIILRNISSLLKKNGIQHGYLYEEEPYSGGLLLEMGMLDQFWEYGGKVLEFLRKKGVRKLITVDPHTTNAMLRLREHFQSDIEVVNYLNIVSPSSGSGKFVFHDPCLYSRYNTIGDRIRKIAASSGVELIEDRLVTSREYGTCCGGPLGPVDTELSESIASYRASKLLSVSKNVLVACPLCYQNLKPYIQNIKDVSEVIQ